MDVLLHCSSHAGPEILACYTFKCFVFAEMSIQWCIMMFSDDLCSNLLVRWDVYLAVLRVYNAIGDGEHSMLFGNNVLGGWVVFIFCLNRIHQLASDLK